MSHIQAQNCYIALFRIFLDFSLEFLLDSSLEFFLHLSLEFLSDFYLEFFRFFFRNSEIFSIAFLILRGF